MLLFCALVIDLPVQYTSLVPTAVQLLWEASRDARNTVICLPTAAVLCLLIAKGSHSAMQDIKVSDG